MKKSPVITALALSAVIIATAAAPIHAQQTATPSQKSVAAPQIASSQADALLVKSLVRKYGEHLVKARYMEKNCEPVTWPGWENLPTLKCRYAVTDRANNNTKYAEIVMLNAPPDKIARWAVTACHDAGSTNTQADADKLIKHILGQSGGQFPIAGVVYEDMEGDGYMKAYCFRNGVTTRIKGVPHRTTETLTAAQIEASLHGPIEKVYTYARIASTTPEQYKANGGTMAVGTNKDRTKAWPQAVGDLYRKAWNSDRNELISAWAKANL